MPNGLRTGQVDRAAVPAAHHKRLHAISNALTCGFGCWKLCCHSSSIQSASRCFPPTCCTLLSDLAGCSVSMCLLQIPFTAASILSAQQSPAIVQVPCLIKMSGQCASRFQKAQRSDVVVVNVFMTDQESHLYEMQCILVQQLIQGQEQRPGQRLLGCWRQRYSQQGEAILAQGELGAPLQ